MKIAQEVNLGKTDVEGNVEKAANDLAAFVNQAFREQQPLHEAEHGIWQRVLQIGRQAMQTLLHLHGDGDVGEQVELENGQIAKRLREHHPRSYVSVFGPFELSRVVYGSREGQAIECVPLDIRLALPESKFSYLLQEWDQFVACEEPYAKVSQFLEKILDLRQHVDSLERMSRRMAEDVESFRESLPAPPAKEEGAIFVVSADGKGVPIRRPADAPRIHEHRSQRGPKKDRKRMAIVGAAYSIDPYVRTAEEVVDALFRAPAEERPASRRPEPCHKRVCASLTLENENEDEAREAIATVFGWLAQQQQERNPSAKKTVTAVMDGQESLWEALHLFQPPEITRVEILDLLHVTPRLWQAAHLFHAVKSSQAEQFVRERLLRILRGGVGEVIRGLRQMGTKRRLGASAHNTLRRICNYLDANRGRMRYDEYLASGYPIASGVIEGACRHYVKDRMERTGMSWRKPGAQAMLELRATYLNGDWDAFVHYHIDRETNRLYPNRHAFCDEPYPLAA